MAVEARHLNPFPPSQTLASREFAGFNELGAANAQMGSGAPLAQSAPQKLFPLYHSFAGESIPAKAADSGLTHNLPVPRKRIREAMVNQFDALAAYRHKNHTNTNPNLSQISSALLGEDISRQFLQQQSEIDNFIVDQTEKVRQELSERRSRHSLVLAAAIEEAIARRLKEKDEEIDRMRKINWLLQDRVKCLCVENQVWKELAQTNEAAATSLRTNLEQVLAHASDERPAAAAADADAAEDCASSCGSSHHRGKRLRTAAEDDDAATDSAGAGHRMCRNCGERESRVLLLPCRHLCLCTACGSSRLVCPVCHATMNASVHVNMS